MREVGIFFIGITFMAILSAISCSDETKDQDTTPPTVNSTFPESGADSVLPGVELVVNFSETMDASSIDSSSFRLSGNMAGTVSYDGQTATFTPESDLTSGTSYTATVSSSVRDSRGNRMAKDYSWSFTTAPTPIVISQGIPLGEYHGTFTYTSDYGSSQAESHSQPIVWTFTETEYRMKIDIGRVYDTNFALCRVEGKWLVALGMTLLQSTSVPDQDAGQTICDDTFSPKGQFTLIKGTNLGDLRLTRFDVTSRSFMEIEIHL